MMHKGIDWHQKQVMKRLKGEFRDIDLIMHIDFAENYGCKYGREIQETHFGGNKPPQITIHAGVSYNASEVKSFCTVT